jgi:hypothetical protein
MGVRGPRSAAAKRKLAPSLAGFASRKCRILGGCPIKEVSRKVDIAIAPRGSPLTTAGFCLCASLLGCCGALAQEYCIACTQPNAIYRCVIEDARPGGQSLTRLCLTALTKDGGHANCSVKGGTVFDCNGPIKRVPWAAQESGRVVEPATQEPGNQAATGAKSAPKGEPKTVVDMAKQANENMQKANEGMKDQAQSAGQAIGKATKKTWECMWSLFIRC